MFNQKIHHFSFNTLLVILTFISCFIITSHYPGSSFGQKTSPKRLEDLYPGIISGALGKAVLAKLPKGTLLTAGELVIKEADLTKEINRSSPTIQKQLAKNIFYLLENETMEGLLSLEASKAGYKDGEKKKRIVAFLSEKMKAVKVSEEEIKIFYNQNKAIIGNTPLEEVRGFLKEYLSRQKGEEAVRQYFLNLGNRVPILLNETWAENQKRSLQKNPVDHARLSGKPTMVEFGAPGCAPCEMMTPILADLKKKYASRLNVLFIHVGNEQILGERFGIQVIPVQVFFDQKGREVFRHTGFFPQAELEQKLTQLEFI